LDLPPIVTELISVYDWDHVRGPEDARFTLIEYGDYECPDCGAVFQALRGLHDDFPSRFRLVYRHYPYSGIHKNAEMAAQAAEAAAAQGRFWEMHDLLFQNQTALQWKDLLKYADILGLDVGRFRKELKSQIHSEVVRQNFIRGVHDGVRGTPGLFLNGFRHNGRFEDWDLRTIFEGL
jgi:protein-disulfide isomerase